jgi:hypothetical protein
MGQRWSCHFDRREKSYQKSIFLKSAFGELQESLQNRFLAFNKRIFATYNGILHHNKDNFKLFTIFDSISHPVFYKTLPR